MHSYSRIFSIQIINLNCYICFLFSISKIKLRLPESVLHRLHMQEADDYLAVLLPGDLICMTGS